jgi:polysaccharide export outer membrane protein
MDRHAFRIVVLAISAAILALGACAPRPPVVAASVHAPYVLGSGDKVRVTVYGQPNLSAVYPIDQAGLISMPLIGPVQAAGVNSFELQKAITSRLRNGYLRNPDVTVAVDTYRPFFVLGEVTNAGQYPYQAGITAEKAVAVAGGFSPRARHDSVMIARRIHGRVVKFAAPVTTPLMPGDVVTARERWF